MSITSKKPTIFKVTRTPKGLDQILSVKPDVASHQYSAVINVSDSPCASFDYQLNLPSFWFPINEVGRWDYSPFFGALKVVNEYYKGEKPILIHCHAGANRSPSIAYAILLAKGYTIEEAEESLNYKNMSLVFKRNIERKHIPDNIINFLKATDKNPALSLYGVLRQLDIEYETWSQNEFNEQNNCVVSVGLDKKVRLVYSQENKRFVVKTGE